MNGEKFLEDFINQFDEIPEGVNMDTQFKDIEGWDSLTSLMIISMVDDVYSIKISGKDIENSITIKDIYDILLLKYKNV